MCTLQLQIATLGSPSAFFFFFATYITRSKSEIGVLQIYENVNETCRIGVLQAMFLR
jgi:hypothetical protein